MPRNGVLYYKALAVIMFAVAGSLIDKMYIESSTHYYLWKGKEGMVRGGAVYKYNIQFVVDVYSNAII